MKFELNKDDNTKLTTSMLKPIIRCCVIIVLLPLAVLSQKFDTLRYSDDSSNSKHIQAFLNLLHKFDLNEFTEQGFTITKSEYQHLQNSWGHLSEYEKSDLIKGPSRKIYQCTLTLFILHALHRRVDWDKYTSKMTKFGTGLSLTLSRIGSPVSLYDARQSLVDLLNDSSSFKKDGQIKITESIKLAAQNRIGKSALERLEDWEDLINSSRELDELEKMNDINNFINQQIQPKSDDNNLNGYDYWQSPIESLVRGFGDCEDYAFAKYISLRLLGIPADRMTIAIVHYPEVAEMHAVLFVFPEGESDPYVLDNLPFWHLGHQRSHIVRLGYRIQRHNFKPFCGINEKIFVEYTDEFRIKAKNTRPCDNFPRFAIVINNSQQIMMVLNEKS